MSETPNDPEFRTVFKPTQSLLKRIDIGLFTGVCALLVSFLAMITARAQFKQYRATQQAIVLPIIDIDMGYIKRDERDFFEVKFNNVGTGVAHIQRVTPMIKGEKVPHYDDFDAAIMTGRMRSWATLTEGTAAGYLRAGESVTPVSYRIAGSASELGAYLRGQFGTPLDGVDMEVCYCSVFNTCWSVQYLNRRPPQEVKACIAGDVPEDGFQTFLEQRKTKRQSTTHDEGDQE